MRGKRNLQMGALLISAFALWTVLIRCVDVKAVGQNGTKIGSDIHCYMSVLWSIVVNKENNKQ